MSKGSMNGAHEDRTLDSRAPDSQPMARSEAAAEGHDVTRCDKTYILRIFFEATWSSRFFADLFCSLSIHIILRHHPPESGGWTV